MKHVEEYRRKDLVTKMANEIAAKIDRPMTLMEVCGTHTMAVHRHGMPEILPRQLRLLSGPGCPVCVTPISYIDAAIELSRRDDMTLATFGDLVRVPGSSTSLERRKAEGADVVIVYSPLDAVSLAGQRPDRHVVFLAVGFETTAPTVAASISEAKSKGVKNFSVLVGHKLVPPALVALLQDKEVKIDGFICPGHVSTIIGAKAYEPIVNEFGVPCVVAGFEPVDILAALSWLVEMVVTGKPQVRNAYTRVVTENGNTAALKCMYEVFEAQDSTWRGLGTIPASGLTMKDAYEELDAVNRFGLTMQDVPEISGCCCGDVLRGAIEPTECALFAVRCTPERPVGPCMVSSEGTCAAFYKYRLRR
ncbi:MAG: hydrogenase formation protein HypD [Candidatus Hydrogenedentes bacterium]|nr:hydrogenase formation protein HypD [Candidatus Hydrogenedentota bacterium]